MPTLLTTRLLNTLCINGLRLKSQSKCLLQYYQAGMQVQIPLVL